MKRFIVIVAVLAIAVYLWHDRLFSLAAPFAEGMGMANPQKDFVEISDSNGRELTCKLTAKSSGFIQIQREADGQSFILPMSRLSSLSRKRFGLVPDFNEDVIETDLLKQAERKIEPELLYVPELCTFICPHNGRKMESEIGMMVEAYRDYLQENHIRFHEVRLDAEPSGDGGYYLPAGLKTIPCYRVGEEIIYKRDSKKIRQAMIEQYLAMSD